MGQWNEWRSEGFGETALLPLGAKSDRGRDSGILEAGDLAKEYGQLLSPPSLPTSSTSESDRSARRECPPAGPACQIGRYVFT
jgi:hypothetical protein